MHLSLGNLHDHVKAQAEIAAWAARLLQPGSPSSLGRPVGRQLEPLSQRGSERCLPEADANRLTHHIPSLACDIQSETSCRLKIFARHIVPYLHRPLACTEAVSSRTKKGAWETWKYINAASSSPSAHTAKGTLTVTAAITNLHSLLQLFADCPTPSNWHMVVIKQSF